MPAPDSAVPEGSHDAELGTLPRRVVLPTWDDNWLVGTLLLAATAATLLFGHGLTGLWHTLLGEMCLPFAARALMGLWTLGFVPVQSRRTAFFERGNQTLLGALAFVCAVLLLR